MISKLRFRFILIAALSITLVVGVIIAVINVNNYSQINRYADQVLQLLYENDGLFPPKLHFSPKNDNFITVETPFETRFFTVILDENGNEIAHNIKNIAAIDGEEAVSIAVKVYKSEKKEGKVDNFKFVTKSYSDSMVLYIFLDCSREIKNFKDVLTTSILVSTIGIIIIVALVTLFSKIAFKPINESYRKQKSFITNASHDIKTPLTVIGAEAEILEMDYGENECTSEIKKQIATLSALTEKLVFLSCMEEERQIEFKPFCLSDTFYEVVQPYERIAVKKGLSFKVDCENDVVFCGNEEYLCRCFSLLLDNALKYSADCGTVFLSLKKNGKTIEITFENQVSGMPAGNYNDLFDRFYRLEKSRNSTTGGNGIGLSVVKSIVNAHKGKIKAFNKNGTHFTIVINLPC